MLKQEMARLEKLEVRMLSAADEQISLTDPDARSMATSGCGTGMAGYSQHVTTGGIRCGLPVLGDDSEVYAQMRADARFQPVVRPKGQIASDEADMAAVA